MGKDMTMHIVDKDYNLLTTGEKYKYGIYDGRNSEWFSNLWSSIKEVFSEVGTWFTEKFTEAKDGVTNGFNTVKDFFSEVWEGIKSVWSTVSERS